MNNRKTYGTHQYLLSKIAKSFDVPKGHTIDSEFRSVEMTDVCRPENLNWWTQSRFYDSSILWDYLSGYKECNLHFDILRHKSESTKLGVCDFSLTLPLFPAEIRFCCWQRHFIVNLEKLHQKKETHTHTHTHAHTRTHIYFISRAKMCKRTQLLPSKVSNIPGRNGKIISASSKTVVFTMLCFKYWLPWNKFQSYSSLFLLLFGFWS